MTPQQIKAATFQKAPTAANIELPHNEQFKEYLMKAEIKSLRDKLSRQCHANVLLQRSLDYFQDKADTLEKMCVDNGIMKAVRL